MIRRFDIGTMASTNLQQGLSAAEGAEALSRLHGTILDSPRLATGFDESRPRLTELAIQSPGTTPIRVVVPVDEVTPELIQQLQESARDLPRIGISAEEGA